MFGSVVALKGFGDVSFRLAAMVIAEFSQTVGVVFAGDNGPDDVEAGLAGDVRDDLGEFEVHQLQGLLHMLNMLGSASNEVGSMTGISSEGAHLFIGVERAAQQAEGMELLYPLAILDIAFATGHIFEVMGIDQFDLKAPIIEDFINGDPIDAG